jgi:hypothetical protein
MNQRAKEEWDKKQAEEADKNKKQTEVFHNLHLVRVLQFCYKFEYMVYELSPGDWCAVGAGSLGCHGLGICLIELGVA